MSAESIRNGIVSLSDEEREHLRKELFDALSKEEKDKLEQYNQLYDNNINHFPSVRTLESDSVLVDDLKRWFAKYLDVFVQKSAFSWDKGLLHDIRHTIDAIEKALDLYFLDQVGEAVECIKQLLADYAECDFFSTTLDKSYALRGAACFPQLHSPNFDYSLMRNHELTFYRARVSDIRLTQRKEMVHRPYKADEVIPQQRFTCQGMPALYLSTTSYGCYLELGKPDKNLYVSAFKPLEAGNRLKVFNLLLSQNLINGIYNAGIDQSERYALQKKIIALFPLVVATSYKCKTNENDHQKAEYVFPELVMRSLRPLGIDGIAYLSKLVDEAHEVNQFLYTNIVIPVYKDALTAGYGDVCDKFLLTNPVLFNQQNNYGDIMSGSYIYDVLYNSDYEGILYYRTLNQDGDIEYKDSAFAKFDNFLVKQAFGKYNSDCK